MISPHSPKGIPLNTAETFLRVIRFCSSFPGGYRDAEDASIKETALREIHEELGIDSSKIETWAQLARIPNRVSCIQFIEEHVYLIQSLVLIIFVVEIRFSSSNR